MKKYDGLIDALRTTVKEEGLTGLYKGIIPALFLTSHGAIQFSIYEAMKLNTARYYNYQNTPQPAWISIMMGGLSKIVASTVTYPYQLVKSRMQQRDFITIEGTNDLRPRYTSNIDCVRSVYRNDGFKGFFRGVGPNVLKVAPSSAITFLIYEETMKVLRDRAKGKEHS